MALENTMYLLEKERVFSQSLLWELQQRYFAERGVEAWRQGEVPSYVTSNPMIANSYAEIVLALWHDQQRLAPDARRNEEPLYICELGAGSGRFAFHFLCQLNKLCVQACLEPTTFCYVATDFTQNTLDFWRQHPRFQPFFSSGMLDLARFDLTDTHQLVLQRSGRTIRKDGLARPLIVIANYVFDSIPQDLYYINDQRCSSCLVSLFLDQDPALLPRVEMLEHVSASYTYQEIAQSPYAEPSLQNLLTSYQHTLSDTHLLFPATGLRCLERLRTLSKVGLLVLSADKGDHRLRALQGQPLPSLVQHGSFSLMVNYHAFGTFCEQSGGIALFPDRYHNHLNVGCLLLLDQAREYKETARVYQRIVGSYGPDDFYSISTHARQHIDELTTSEILAYTRLSHYDSHLFTYFLPQLLKCAPTCDADERETIIDTLERVWEGYFPLGEPLDLANQMARLLSALADYKRALQYFERSRQSYGQHSETLYRMALCYESLHQGERAQQLLESVVQCDSTNQKALVALERYRSQ